jgi:cytochrome P450
MAGKFGNNGSIFTTSNHDLHKLRRSALNPLFSKRSILNLQSVILSKVSILCNNIAQYEKNEKVLTISNAWSALAGDVICDYAFGYSYAQLESPDFEESFHEAFMAVSEFGHVALQFPWVNPVSQLSQPQILLSAVDSVF